MEITTYEQVQLDKSAVALGKFQGLHRGHMLLLDKIISLKNEGLTSVVFTINVPSAQSIYLPEERFAILEECGVDVAVECDFSESFASMSPEDFVRNILVERLHAAYVVVGEDFKFGYNRKGTVDRLVQFGIKYGFRVIAFEKLRVDDEVVSSSFLRSLIERGALEHVSRYMSRDYSLTGIVAQGKQLGRTIGFPTVNFYPPAEKMLPPAGVYETQLHIDGKSYQGITNIGDNPTVDNDGRLRVETHIIDYSGDLYGKRLTVFFKRFIRHEIKFHNVDELKKQIETDKKQVLHQ